MKGGYAGRDLACSMAGWASCLMVFSTSVEEGGFAKPFGVWAKTEQRPYEARRVFENAISPLPPPAESARRM